VTVLGTASKVYVGNVAAVAVYAGSVKVWPTAAPEPPGASWPPAPKAGADGVGRWRMDHPNTGGLLVLEIASTRRDGNVTIDIDPYTGTPQAASNPFRGFMWQPYTPGAFPVLNMQLSAPVWNGYYPAQWGGHRLRFGVSSGQVTTFTNLGVSPA
jgi:hypothetical protein